MITHYRNPSALSSERRPARENETTWSEEFVPAVRSVLTQHFAGGGVTQQENILGEAAVLWRAGHAQHPLLSQQVHCNSNPLPEPTTCRNMQAAPQRFSVDSHHCQASPHRSVRAFSFHEEAPLFLLLHSVLPNSQHQGLLSSAPISPSLHSLPLFKD